MARLFGFLLFFVFILSIKTVDADVNYKLMSVYYGNQGWFMDQINNLTLWLGKHQVVITLFTDWCNDSMYGLYNTQLNNIWNDKSIPLITWGLMECNGVRQPGIIKLVNNNTFDAYLNEFSDRLKKWLSGNDGIYGNDDDRRAYLRLAHEMNGNWFRWSLNSTPTDFVMAWHHVHSIFSNKGVDSTRLQWIWSVNNQDFGNYTAEEYWVGDDYVDWIGVDGYNWGKSQSWFNWQWPNQVFDDMIGRIRKIAPNKPLSINEYGTTSMIAVNDSSAQNKSEWLNQFCDYVSNSQVKMASYLDTDVETDWAIFGGMHGDIVWNNFKAYTAYKNCVQSNEWIQPNITNQRLITDDQFAGKL